MFDNFWIGLGLILFSFTCGAISHELDVARNCNEKGKSALWTTEIVCVKQIKTGE